ncbi:MULTISPECIES: hypothetical protein [unclassified Moorena]|uniref:hypothetical protein n=1 Tax=unclassified Moorena TaxID=2683338 RepID=UPI0013C5A08E|nr:MULTISPECIES: hypothetical protein [unclassified Moorena]NEO19834.1 hypothetical protein [Moorena sp. SIO4A5]NEQ56574.1 hypothetical protein [Moorena sp. SIO4A1]
MRYTGFFPCSLFPVPCSLKPRTLYLTQLKTAIFLKILRYISLLNIPKNVTIYFIFRDFLSFVVFHVRVILVAVISIENLLPYSIVFLSILSSNY